MVEPIVPSAEYCSAVDFDWGFLSCYPRPVSLYHFPVSLH